MTNSVQLRIQIPKSMIEKVRYEDELKAKYDWRHSDEYITDMIYANWRHDEIVSYCLENEEPVVWQSANC